MKKILINYQIPRSGLTELEERYEVYYPSETLLPREKLLELIPQYDALLSIFNEPIDATIFEAGKKLKIVSNYGVGYNNIDLEAAHRHNIFVCNVPNAVCTPTVELTWGLLLACMRNISYCNLNLRYDPNFKWGVMEHLSYDLMGKTLGIVGMGNIGRSVAKIAKPFGMKVLYYNRRRLAPPIEKEYDATYVSLDQLLQESDAVSLHTPLNSESQALMNARAFSLMKPTAFLINTARGEVVDEKALVEALKSGEIAGAGLDVFENEPVIHHELLKMPNVTLTSHIGTTTHQTRVNMAIEASQNIIHYFETGKLINHVKRSSHLKSAGKYRDENSNSNKSGRKATEA